MLRSHRLLPVLLMLVACGPLDADSDDGGRSIMAGRPPTYGAWVPHTVLNTTAQMTAVIDRARAAGLDTLYVAFARYGCGFFPSAHLPRCAGSKLDSLSVFLDLAEPAGIRVVPWFERLLQVPPGSVDGALVEAVPLSREGFDVLDVASPAVREMLLGGFAELAADPRVREVQVDDHVAYDAALAGSSKGQYQAKLTRFVNWLATSFHEAAPGKAFTIAPNPLAYSKANHLAAWDGWTAVDGVLVQCYRSTGSAVVADGSCTTPAGRVSGLGVAGTWNGKPLSDESLLTVLRYQHSRRRSFALFHVGELFTRPSLAAKMALVLGR